MILAVHSIISTYGFWLPNEPRGSWSIFVANWELYRFGAATKVHTRRSVAGRPFSRPLKAAMTETLRHPPVRFTGEQARAVAHAFSCTPYTLHALAIMPEHIHLVIAHTPRPIRQTIGHLKADATRALRNHDWFTARTPWAAHSWNVYLDSHDDVWRAIDYVNENPRRSGLRPQHWSCVVPYDRATSRAAEARRKRRG